MPSWTALGRWIHHHDQGSKTWRSEQNSLLAIFSELYHRGFDPAILAPCYPHRLSHLKAIIRPMKEAIVSNDRDRIMELGEAAGTLTMKRLRLFLGTPRRQAIRYQEYEVFGLPSSFYKIVLTKSQFANISNLTQTQYHFLPWVEEEENVIDE